MSIMTSLKDLNWQRHGKTGLKILMDFKVLGLVFLLLFTFFGIGWDTVLKPNLETIKSRDESISTARAELSRKQESRQHLATLEQQLSSQTTTMLSVPAGNSSTVLAVAESATILKIAKGTDPKSSLLLLPKPHNQREDVSLTAQGASSTVDMITLIPGGSSSPASSPPPSSSSNAPMGMSGQPTPSSGSTTPPSSQPGSGSGSATAATAMPVERFNYELKATGTYPALMDLINSLVLSKKLIKINKIVITPNTTQNPANLPDAKTDPDFPFKLDIVISLSLFLYNAAAASSPATAVGP